MTISWNIQPKGITKTVKNFVIRRNRLKDKSAMFKTSTSVIIAWIQENFKQEGGKHENPALKWQELSEITVAKRGGKAHPILVRTGRLKNSFKVVKTKDGFRIVNPVPYASLHEKGGMTEIDGKQVFVPRRKIMPAQYQALKIISPLVRQYLDRNVGKI